MTSFEAGPTGHLTTAEVEVAGSPEAAWDAIASPTGTSGWLFPTDVEGREGGQVVIHRAPFGGDAVAKVVVWEPPHRFAYVEEEGDAPAWATEFLVEARSGGTCIVRVVNGMVDGAEGWEDMIEGAGEGWRGALEMLKVYVAHFAGQPGWALNGTLDTGRPLADRAQVSAELLQLMGVAGRGVGETVHGPDGTPPLAGVVETASADGLLVRTTAPCPAIFEISTFSMNGETVTVNVCAHAYGPDAAAVVERDEPRWNAWLARHFAPVRTS
jgi:uncharacterized protein YndB with AHSA1/START domain